MKSAPRWTREWPAFEAAIKQRLIQGHLEYGDGSFERPVPTTLEELAEEALDMVGWSFIMWVRIRDMIAETADHAGDGNESL